MDTICFQCSSQAATFRTRELSKTVSISGDLTGLLSPFCMYCLYRREDEDWNEPVEVLAGDAAPLSTPKPDLGFGLRPEIATYPTTSDRPQDAPALSEETLEAMRLRLGLHPWPSPGLPEVVFPCVIFEAKSDSSVLFYAENQAAGGAATALKMLESLRTAYATMTGAPAQENWPVVVICSQGSLWEVLLAFHRDTLDGLNGIVSHIRERADFIWS